MNAVYFPTARNSEIVIPGTCIEPAATAVAASSAMRALHSAKRQLLSAAISDLRGCKTSQKVSEPAPFN